jgi:hypothetical protein
MKFADAFLAQGRPRDSFFTFLGNTPVFVFESEQLCQDFCGMPAAELRQILNRGPRA